MYTDLTPFPPQLQSEIVSVEHPGSDYVVDVLRALDLEYCASNCGSSFEGLQESIVNHGGNRRPEFLTCLHEESAVAMAHGYAKIAGKPMIALLHGTIGIQHASMAIYNAYCDRVPIFLMAGLDYDGPVPAHNATDMAALVRDFVKWDHQPDSLEALGRSAVRAYRVATTPPMAPVLVVVDAKLQKAPAEGALPVPPISRPHLPSADPGSVREIARMLVDAENPRITAGLAARTQEGIDRLVELAELLQAPVDGGSARLNFPSRHPLAGAGTGQPDVVLNLEPGGRGAAAAPRARTITISSAEFLVSSNFNIYGSGSGTADLLVAADAQATLPALIEEVRRLVTDDRRRFFDERGAAIAAAHAERPPAGYPERPLRLGRQPGQPGPHRRRAVASDQGRGLVVLVPAGLHRRLAGAALGHAARVSRHRLAGRRRHRLLPARLGRRGAGQIGSTDGSRSTSTVTATSTTRRERCGRRCITGFRC